MWITAPASLRISWSGPAPWPASPLPIPNHTTAPHVEKSRDSSEQSAIVFLSGVHKGISLEEINEAFWLWLREDYHHKIHTGIKEKPIDRYNVSLQKASIRRLSKSELDNIFLMRHERVVNNDSTISFKGAIYEVPTAYIRQKIEIRHPIDDPEGPLSL